MHEMAQWYFVRVLSFILLGRVCICMRWLRCILFGWILLFVRVFGRILILCWLLLCVVGLAVNSHILRERAIIGLRRSILYLMLQGGGLQKNNISTN